MSAFLETTKDSAFPVVVKFEDGTEVLYAPGMALRDYFAAKALIGIMADPTDTQPYTNDELAHWCYQVADAMLKAREE